MEQVSCRQFYSVVIIYVDRAFARQESRPGDAANNHVAQHPRFSRPFRPADRAHAPVFARRSGQPDGYFRRLVGPQRGPLRVLDPQARRCAPGHHGLQWRRVRRFRGAQPAAGPAGLRPVAGAHPVGPVRLAAPAGPDPPAPAGNGHAPVDGARQGFICVLGRHHHQRPEPHGKRAGRQGAGESCFRRIFQVRQAAPAGRARHRARVRGLEERQV